jgi:uncharacterized protein
MTAQRLRVVYLHGFNSSPLSLKARQFLDYCEQQQIEGVVPQLSYDPAVAIRIAEECVLQPELATLVIGSSLGGYYATWLAERYGVKAVLINPAVLPHQIMGTEFLGPQKNHYSGDSYEFTRVHVAALAELAMTTLSKPANFLLLAQTGDEVLDYRHAVRYYAGATQEITEGGNHSFVGFAAQLPRIMAFAGIQASPEQSKLVSS